MNRRKFLGAGLLGPVTATLGLAGTLWSPQAAAAQAAAERPLSYAARYGLLPNVPLVAHTGETFNFYDDLVRDRIVLLNFFVVGCSEGRCPTTNATLRKVQDMFGERMGKDVFFYSVTLQPELDTVPILKEYAEDVFEVKPGWLFLTGKQSDIDTLRRAQGFVDPDPERDSDVTLHSSAGRLIDDNHNRWAMVPLNTSARNVYTVLNTL
ncbi:MAG: SCO family protein [Comamonadaceae bacterium]